MTHLPAVGAWGPARHQRGLPEAVQQCGHVFMPGDSTLGLARCRDAGHGIRLALGGGPTGPGKLQTCK